MVSTAEATQSLLEAFATGTPPEGVNLVEVAPEIETSIERRVKALQRRATSAEEAVVVADEAYATLRGVRELHATVNGIQAVDPVSKQRTVRNDKFTVVVAVMPDRQVRTGVASRNSYSPRGDKPDPVRGFKIAFNRALDSILGL